MIQKSFLKSISQLNHRMSKPTHKIILIVLFCCLAIIASSQTSVSSQQQSNVKPSWSFIFSEPFYDRNLNFTLSNGVNSNNIVFSIWANQINTTFFQITQQGYWKSQYVSQNAQVKVVGHGQNLLARIHWRDPINSLNFTLYQKNRPNSSAKISILYDKKPQTAEYYEIINGCSEYDQIVNCVFNYSKTIEIQFDSTGVNGTDIAKMQKIIEESTQANIDAFLKKLNISPNSTEFTRDFARQMLQNTLSSLCSQKVSYYDDRYFGLCSSSNSKQIDLHYSLLVIDILFNYNPQMGIWLTENFLNLLEQKLFYEFQGKQWIPIPEHIEVFVTYLRQITKSKSLSQTQKRKSINKVIQIQNGLINSLLLSQVNHLSQEINYRQNNKIHPTIMKMLTQAWKTDSPRARVSSIYTESFTNDFYYHQQNEKLDTSVGKMMWLLKLINQHLMVVRTWGDSFQKESLEQLVSLAKVMHGFVLQDQRAKNGDFHSIIEAENLRLYTRSVGYESLLPFAYDISPVFPTTTLLNLTTSAGLASMPLGHEKAKQTYNFRGNINLYFNFKILFNMIKRCELNPKFRVFYPGLKTVIESIQRSIIATYAEGKNNDNVKFYTSWTAKGKGVSTERHLGVINLAFMEELKQIPQSASIGRQTKTKPEKKQSTQ